MNSEASRSNDCSLGVLELMRIDCDDNPAQHPNLPTIRPTGARIQTASFVLAKQRGDFHPFDFFVPIGWFSEQI